MLPPITYTNDTSDTVIGWREILSQKRLNVIAENSNYSLIKINQSSIYPECEIKGIRYNMICNGTGTGEIQYEDVYTFFYSQIKQNDLIYQSCGDKSEDYCAVQNKNPLFCGEYNATRQFIKDSYTCNYNTPCHIEDYNTGNIEYILDYIDTHEYTNTVYGNPNTCVLDCPDHSIYGDYFCKPIKLPIIHKELKLQEINTNQTIQECVIRTVVHNVFYKDITHNPHPATDNLMEYNIIDYENTVQYNSCERDDYPPIDDRYCIINKGQDHFCGEYQAVKTWIDQNPRDCKRLGDCFIQNRHVDYYEDVQYGLPHDLPDIFHNCDVAVSGNYTNDFTIMDNELFTIWRIPENITMKISDLNIDHTQDEHFMVFDFKRHPLSHKQTLTVQFEPKDGKYQFIESIDFFDYFSGTLLRNNPIYVNYNDQCSMTEFYLDWKKPN